MGNVNTNKRTATGAIHAKHLFLIIKNAKATGLKPDIVDFFHTPFCSVLIASWDELIVVIRKIVTMSVNNSFHEAAIFKVIIPRQQTLVPRSSKSASMNQLSPQRTDLHFNSWPNISDADLILL